MGQACHAVWPAIGLATVFIRSFERQGYGGDVSASYSVGTVEVNVHR